MKVLKHKLGLRGLCLFLLGEPFQHIADLTETCSLSAPVASARAHTDPLHSRFQGCNTKKEAG